MIERGTSRSKHGIAKWQGKHLCSSVNPLQEAKQWVAKHASRARGVRQILVLGAGCGYHLAALQKEFPEQKILVIETCAELIEFAKTENALELHDVQFAQVSDIESFTRNSKVQRLMKNEYSVLKFAPATITNDQLYRAIENLVLGREEQGFNFILAHRPDLQVLFQPARPTDTRELISIKNIETALQPNQDNTSGLVVKALRELIN